MRQSSKTGTLKITNPQSLELAGTIKSTSETFVGESDGRYALSTSASTTITNAQNLYPELWNRAPAGWQSGSDLVVPAQGVPNTTDWIDYTKSGYGGDFGNSTWDYLKYKKTGNTISLKGALVAGSTFAPGSSLILDLIPDGLSVLNPVNYLQIAGNVGYLKSGSNSTYGNAGYASLFQLVSSWMILFHTSGSTGANQSAFVNTNNPFTWTAGDNLEFVLQDIEIDEEGITPYIHLYDSKASGALGLPEASASQAGIVSTGAQTFAGDKTFTGNVDAASYTGLPVATSTTDGIAKKGRFGTIKLVTDENATVTDIATNGDPANSGFKFENLTIGKVYELSLNAKLQITGDSTTESMIISAIHNGSTITRVILRHDGVNDATDSLNGSTVVFVATATTITFDFTEFGLGLLLGNNSFGETYAVLKELNDYEATDLGNDFS